MGDQMLFETACKQGRLAITRDRVALQRGRAGRWRATWTLPRSTVSGMSSQLAGSRYELTIHTQGGRRFTLHGVAPVDTLKTVALLGYVQSSQRPAYPAPPLPAPYRRQRAALAPTAGTPAPTPRPAHWPALGGGRESRTNTRRRQDTAGALWRAYGWWRGTPPPLPPPPWGEGKRNPAPPLLPVGCGARPVRTESG